MLAVAACGATIAEPLYKDSSAPIDKRVEDLIQKMTLEEKADYISGMRLLGHSKNVWDGTKGNDRLGIRPFKIYHGPYGISASRYTKKNGTYYPSSINMATTWDRALVREVTTSLSRELNASGGQSSAGPAMNIIRDLRSGRSMEYFTEDPYLNGEIAAAYTEGVQSQKNFAIMKHFVCNNQEQYRNSIEVTVSERALREIYLPGYKRCVEAGIMGVMTGYNNVNDNHNSAYKHLVQDILKDEWGFEGVVMTDWAGSAKSTKAMVDAGLDLEMPRPTRYKKETLLSAIKKGEISEKQIDEKLRRILRLTFWSGVMDEAPTIDPNGIATTQSVEIARSAAEQSLVLLQNENGLLPIDRTKVKRIAVIGPNGEYGKHFREGARTYQMLQGGGSASIVPQAGKLITPLTGIKNSAGEGLSVEFAAGCYGEQGCTTIAQNFLRSESGEVGLDGEYFNNDQFSGKATKKIDKKIDFNWFSSPVIIEEGNSAGKPTKNFSIKWSGKIQIPESGDYTFMLSTIGDAKLYINKRLVVEHKAVQNSMQYASSKVNFDKGLYEIVVRYNNVRGRDQLKLMWDYGNRDYLKKALDLARNSDVVVMPVGTSGHLETESTDRALKLDKSDPLALSAVQEQLIKEVAKVNKNVVVVTYTAGVVCEEWRDKVSSIIYAGFPGQEGANAVGRILFGDVNPSGHLSVSIPKSSTQYPKSWYSFDESVSYDEGIFVGYRYFDKYDLQPSFPFGHGLSYTTFDYSGAKAKRNGDKVTVSVNVKNTGKVTGKEVVQLYIQDIKCSEERPKKELKEFAKIELQPNESRTVKFTLPEEAFQFFSERSNKWTLERGKFNIHLGSSSADIKASATVEL